MNPFRCLHIIHTVYVHLNECVCVCVGGGAERTLRVILVVFAPLVVLWDERKKTTVKISRKRRATHTPSCVSGKCIFNKTREKQEPTLVKSSTHWTTSVGHSQTGRSANNQKKQESDHEEESKTEHLLIPNEDEPPDQPPEPACQLSALHQMWI